MGEGGEEGDIVHGSEKRGVFYGERGEEYEQYAYPTRLLTVLVKCMAAFHILVHLGGMVQVFRIGTT